MRVWPPAGEGEMGMGNYSESLLAPGETVVYRSHQHWLGLVLDSRIAIVLWATVIVSVILSFFFPQKDGVGTVWFWVETGAFILGVIVVAWRWWNWRQEEYLITTRRLLKVTGVINKRSGDSSLEKINDAILEENLLGRILGYGDLDILTAAEVAVDKYRMLTGAKEFKKQMLQAKHALESGIDFNDISRSQAQVPAPVPVAAPPVAPAGPVPLADPIDTAEEVTAALGRLAELRDKGAITTGEYEVKKRELLGRL
jgi:hypothetical protein